MTQSVFRGPVIAAGNLMNATTMGDTYGPTASPWDGPSIFFQSHVVPDPRFGPLAKDTVSPGAVQSFMPSPFVITYDGIPQASSSGSLGTQTLATGQAFTAGAIGLNTAVVASALVDNAGFWTYGVPIIPRGTSVPVIVGAIDFGFATGTTVANSSTVSVTDVSPFSQGQYLCIGSAGNAAGSTALMTQITAIANATQFNISPVAATARTRAPIGQAGLFNINLPPGTQFGPPTVTPASATQTLDGGLAAVFDPRAGAGRTLVLFGYTTVFGTATLLVSGYDVYGNAMSELLTGNGAAVYGNKAFKYITSAVANTTSTTMSLGLGNTFGFAWRADSPALTYVRNNLSGAPLAGVATSCAQGFTAAFVGASTATTGDIRGTISLYTGSLASSAFGTSIANGTTRITIAQWLAPHQLTLSDVGNSTALFGSPQA